MNDERILEDFHEPIKKNHQRIRNILVFSAMLFGFACIQILLNLIMHNGYEDYLYGNSYEGLNNFSTASFLSSGLSILNAIVFIIFLILLIVWCSRSYFNINRFNLKTNFPEILSSIFWLIPFVNFVMPLIIMKELIHKMEFLKQQVSENRIIGNYNAKFINYWWITFMIGNLLPIVQQIIIAGSVHTYYIIHSNLLDIYILKIISNILMLISFVFLYFALKPLKDIEEFNYNNRFDILEETKK